MRLGLEIVLQAVNGAKKGQIGALGFLQGNTCFWWEILEDVRKDLREQALKAVS